MFFLLHKLSPKLATLLGGIIALSGGIYVGVWALVKRITSLERRLEARDKLLNEIPWQGDETVLDVGCGNGILTMGAAKHLTTGKGIGIDLWTEGSGDQHQELFEENAQLEGVADRVSLPKEDVRDLPYDNEYFDVVVTALTMHHIGFDTDKAIGEMTRVLKPCGHMAIYDEPSTVFYCEKLMRQHGIQVEKKTLDMVFGVKAPI